MALRLSMPADPYWIDLGADVRFKVRAPTFALMEAARAAARRRLETLKAQVADVQGAGGVVTGLPDLTDQDAFSGEFTVALCEEIARFAVMDWSGVSNADGTPAPLTADNLKAAISIDFVGRTFFAVYMTSLDAIGAEGNGSAPAPNTNSAAGANTATDAAPSGEIAA